MNTQPFHKLLARIKRGMARSYRLLWDKPERMVATVILVTVVLLTLSIPLTFREPPAPSAPQTQPMTPVIKEEDIHHAAGTLDAKLAALKKLVFADKNIESTLKQGMGYHNQAAPFAVFFSVSDGKSRASVMVGTGGSLAAAWQSAEGTLRTYAQEHKGAGHWIRADVVNSMELVAAENLPSHIREADDNAFRQGIAFDSEFQLALLENELNGGEMIDYEADELDLPSINIYLAEAGRSGISYLPREVILFTTRGYFCDETDAAFSLSTGRLYYGQREDTQIEREQAVAILSTNATYLMDSLQENGQFRYVYYPTLNMRAQNYNMMRHAEAIWALCRQYSITKLDEVRMAADRAIAFMQPYFKRQEGKLYLQEMEEDETRLGSNAMALVALSEYARVFKDDQYDEQIRGLAAGIQGMPRTQAGGWVHRIKLSDGTTISEEYSKEYNSQAVLALAVAYGQLKEAGYLQAARTAADWLIQNDYAARADQWVAHAMNELTKYAPEQHYVTLAVENAQRSLTSLRNRGSASPHALELLTATLDMTERLTKEKKTALLGGFDKAAVIEAINERARRTLTGYFYPEVAMYMAIPTRVNGVFYNRGEGFRVRLDELQQAINGYAAYVQLYKVISAPQEPSTTPATTKTATTTATTITTATVTTTATGTSSTIPTETTGSTPPTTSTTTEE